MSPIAPHRLFVAANTEETERKFKTSRPAETTIVPIRCVLHFSLR
jgi:hypothetical protein